MPDPDLPQEGAELPPALADMVAERRRSYDEARWRRRASPASRACRSRAWREVASRARILGIEAEMLDDGARLHLEVELPADTDRGVPVEAAAG